MSAADENEENNSTWRQSRETIDWDTESIDYQNQTAGKVPDAKYGAISESIRHTVSEHRACSMFCGGTKCKYCNPYHSGKWKPEQMEVKGLFSNWVTDNILAMSRPTTKAIEEFSIMKQFKELGIKSIINLQLPGEHLSCGFGNEAEGFSYIPQMFMDNDIFFYNFGWQDYGIGSLSNIMDMVKVMQFALSEGKVSIHCHAGLGRTGVLIACYLAYANRLDAQEIIHYIRSKRQGAIQTRGQIHCINEFAAFLKPLVIVYSSIDGAHNDFTLAQYLVRQRHLIHGEEARKLKNIPKIIYAICERLLELAKRGVHHDFHSTYALERETAPKAFINHAQSSNSVLVKHSMSSDDTLRRETASPRVLQHTLSDPNFDLSNLHRPLESRESFTAVSNRTAATQSSISSLSEYMLFESDYDLEYHASDPESQRVAEAMTQCVYTEEQTHSIKQFQSLKYCSLEISVYTNPDSWREAEAMIQCVYTEEQTQSIKQFQTFLNTDSIHAYHEITQCTDAVTLSALLWIWLDELREPVIHPQDMHDMFELNADPINGLKTLEKGAKETIECIFSVICRLEPLSKSLKQDVMCRALSTLTHQNMVLGPISPSDSIVSRTSNQSGLMRPNTSSRLLVFFMGLLDELTKQVHQAALKHHGKKSNTKGGGATSSGKGGVKRDDRQLLEERLKVGGATSSGKGFVKRDDRQLGSSPRPQPRSPRPRQVNRDLNGGRNTSAETGENDNGYGSDTGSPLPQPRKSKAKTNLLAHQGIDSA